MLSILIPTYNYNVFPLVSLLQKQCIASNIEFEIIVMDDGSQSILNRENEKINSLRNCKFKTLTKNIGRSAIRNLLAEDSSFQTLLFVDGDSVVINDHYIAGYLKHHEHADIVYGGRIHPASVNSGNKMLRWKYGKFIEDTTVAQRTKDCYKRLLFNNTIIKKDIFDRIKFDTELQQYGHEDTVFAYQAYQLNLHVEHIDNPVQHGDLEDNAVFVAKTELSLQNTYKLFLNKKLPASFVKSIWLYTLLDRTELDGAVKFFFKFFKKHLYKNLVSNQPYLWVFNVYRIGYLCSLKR